jgi:hypothetical protein
MQGRLHWLSGRHGAARRAWLSSLAAAEALAMPYEAARARYELGVHLDDGSNLSLAINAFRRIGAEWDLKQAEAAIAA